MLDVKNNYVFVSSKRQDTKTKGGLVIPTLLDKGNKWKLGEVFASDPQTGLNKGDTLFYDNNNATSVSYKGEQYFVINVRSVIAVERDEP